MSTDRFIESKPIGIETTQEHNLGVGTERSENLMRIQRDLGLAISSASDLNQILHLCLEAALESSNMDSGGVYLFDENRN